MKSRIVARRTLCMATLCGLVLLATGGCSVLRAYPKYMQEVQEAFDCGDHNRAAAVLTEMSPAARDKICHLCELGTVHHAAGNYEASNTAFLEAVELAEEFDERATVSMRDAGAFASALLLNDKTIPYRGSPFERVLMHTYLAINFLMQHDLEKARVEILRAYAKQKELREQREKQISKTKEQANKRKLNTNVIMDRLKTQYDDQRDLLKKAGNIYQNAFTYYLSAIVYELGDELDEAYIDVKNVHASNPNFLPARRDLLRFAKKLGFASDYEKWREEFGSEIQDAIPEGHGDVVLLYQCGRSPVKKQIKLSIPIPVKNKVRMVSVAIPKYEARPNPVRTARLSANGQGLGTTQALMDVEATAVRDLWDQAPAIALRQAMRAAGRLVAQDMAQRQAGLAGLLVVMIAGHMLEQADLRSWLCLPHDFQVLRASLPAGTYTFEMELMAGSPLGRVSLADVPIESGKITLINLRSTGTFGKAHYVAF